MVFECKNPKYVFKLYKTKKTCSREKFAYDNVSKDIVPKMKFISPMMAIVERAIPFSHVNLNTSELYCRDDDPERAEINEYLEKHYKDICGDFRINNFGMLKGKPVILDIDMIHH